MREAQDGEGRRWRARVFTSVALGWNVCPSVEPAGRGGLSWPKFICDFIYRVTGPTWDEEAVHCDTDARAWHGVYLDGERDATRQDAGAEAVRDLISGPRVKPIRRVNVNTTAQLSKSKHPRMQIRLTSKNDAFFTDPLPE